jgi:uncharacterized protein YjiS (DUF1127 family)
MSTLADRLAALRLHRVRHPANDNIATEPAAPVITPWRGLLAEWRRRVRSRAVLARFSARELRDIGLTPAEAARECAKPFWRE